VLKEGRWEKRADLADFEHIGPDADDNRSFLFLPAKNQVPPAPGKTTPQVPEKTANL